MLFRSSTSTILQAIADGKVDSALVIDKDQKIEVALKSGNLISGSTKLVASYVAGEEPTIVKLLSDNPPSKAWDVKVPTTSFIASLLYSVLPLLVIGFLLLLFMGNAQGGNRIFNFGRSRARLRAMHTSVLRRTRLRRLRALRHT